MSNARHHPREETLAEFAAGRLDEARAVVIATHASMCEACAASIARFEAIGGQLLQAAEPVAMADDALEKIFARAEGAAQVMLRAQTDDAAPERRLPLSDYLAGDLDDVKWRGVAPGLSQSVIQAQGYRDGVLRLLRIKPGTKIPPHTHKGGELTLILRGAYVDEVGEFVVGDLADLDPTHTHAPMATGDEDCVCLIATAAPLQFKTLTGRIAQPFIGL